MYTLRLLQPQVQRLIFGSCSLALRSAAMQRIATLSTRFPLKAEGLQNGISDPDKEMDRNH